MEVDVVTGATVKVETEVARTPEEVWELVTAIQRIGEWSPECVDGWWLTDQLTPVVGARFQGLNRFPSGFEAAVTCEVTEADRPSAFAWAVLDEVGDAERPGSRWRYELHPTATAGRTMLRHQFEHGPGVTGVRVPADQQPARAVEIVTARLQQLGGNMERTLAAMTGASTFSTVWHLGGSVPAEVAR